MLQNIRDKTQGIFATIIVALIGFMFLIWGLGDYMLYQSKGDVAAKINGSQITWHEVDIEAERVARLNPSLANQPNIKDRILAEMAIKAALVLTARESNLAISEDTLRQFVTADNNFQTDGNFDTKKFATYLNMLGMQENEYFARLKEAFILRQLFSAEERGAFIDNNQAARLESLFNQQRYVRYTTVDLSQFAKDLQLTDEQYQNFYDQNPSLFTEPTRLNIEFVQLNAKTLGINPTEADAKKFYEQNIDQLKQPERRRVAHIMVSNDETGRALLENLQGDLAEGADFGELAQTHSTDRMSAENKGEFPSMLERREDMGLFENAAFAAKKGQVTGIIESEFGLHLIKVLEIEPSKTPAFADLKDQIINKLQADALEEKLIGMHEQITTSVFERPQDMAAVAQISGVSASSAKGLTELELLQKFGDAALINTIRTEDFLAGNAVIAELSPDNLIVLRATDITKSYLKPFDKELVKPHLVKSESYKAGIQWAIKKGDEGLKELELKTLKRDTNELPDLIVEKIFSLPASAIEKVSVLGNGTDVYRVYFEKVDVAEPAQPLAGEFVRWYGQLMTTLSRNSAMNRIEYQGKS